MKKILTIVAFFTLVNNLSFSQKLTFDNIAKVYVRSAGPIISGKEVTGYYFLYKLEKVDKKNSLFKLTFTDANLNKVAEKEITMLSNNFVDNASFDGEYISIKFLSLATGSGFTGPSKDGTETIKVYDIKANEIKTISKNANGMAYFYQGMQNGATKNDEIENTNLIAIPKVGLIDVIPLAQGKTSNFTGIKGAKVGVEISMIPLGTSSAKSWKFISPSDEIEIPTYLGTNNEVSIFSIMNKESLMSRTITFKTLCIDNKTGKVMFNKEFEDDKNILYINNYTYLPELNQNIISGTLIRKDRKTKNAKTDGVFLANIDNKGTILKKQYILWDEFIPQFKLKNEEGKPLDISSIYIHKIVSTSDGKIFAIGESHDGAVIKDFIIIELDKELKPIKANVFHKDSHSGYGIGAGQVGSAMLPLVLKYWGAFDYAYTQEKDDKSTFTICYTYKESGTDYFGSISYSDGKFIKDKISLKTEASKLRIYPAKPGYIMINEYFKKEKKMDSRLEKFNL